MRRSYSLLVAAASLSAALLAGCRPGSQWIGVILLDPTGLCYRQDVGRSETLSFALDLARIDNDVVHVHLDWIRYEPAWQGGDIFPYWGLGLDIASWTGNAPPFADAVDTTYVAFRVPLGLEFEVHPARDLVLFLQVVFKAPFEENAGLGLDGAVGIVLGF